MSKPPNIVLILADDITPAYHGCYGGSTPTPHLDRLAAEGVIFTESHAVAALCNPSRYSIFTGQYPGRAPSVSAGCTSAEPYEVSQNANLEPETPSLAKILRSAGYFTGHAGKWHSNFRAAAEREWPQSLGPDADLDDPAVEKRLRESYAIRAAVVATCGGFEWVGAVTWGNLLSSRPWPLQFHNPGWTTDAALEFLDAAATDGRPFYLHLANTLPHGPAPSESFGADHRYTFDGKLAEPPKSLPGDYTVIRRLQQAGIKTDGPIGAINAGAVQIDDQIGAVRRKLEEIGELENTIFLYSADHGIHGKGTCYRGGTWMPLMVHWPQGIPGGRVLDDPISHVDFLPTLCEAAGAEIPADHPLDGVSQLPLWKGEGPGARDHTFQEMGVGRAVTQGRWRYIRFHYPESTIERMRRGEFREVPAISGYRDSVFGDYNLKNKPCYFDPEQLYDLERDPFERDNVAVHPAYESIRKQMETLLYSITDRLPGPYRRDVPPFMRSLAFRRLAESRKQRVFHTRAVYPEGFDQEKMFNLNLPDPLVKK